jgi:thioredoxin reductase (NADPH)
MTQDELDEQFYRDTHAVAFPELDDQQLALLESFGQRRIFRRGEIIFKAGQRDLSMSVVLSGELEVFENRDGDELNLAAPQPRHFIGDVSMLNGTSALATVRGKAEESELLVIDPAEFRRMISEFPRLGEIIVNALIMRRQRLQRDREFSGLRVVAIAGSVEGHLLDDFLDKNRIPHRVIAFDSEEGQTLSDRLNINKRDLPVLIQSNGMPLRRPSLREVAQVAGLLLPVAAVGVTEKFCDVVIIGAGPAGLSAAVNAASEGLKTVVLESYAPGGQAGSSSLIENFFGFPTGISGGDLTYRAQLQAFRFGAYFSTPSQALSLRFTPGGEYGHALQIEGCQATLRAKCVLIATGAEYRRIEAENREDFEGKGVYYAATAMESKLCHGATVIVAGGGNSAGQAAMFLSETAKKVFLVIRGETLSKSMSSYLSQRIETAKNIEILWSTEIRKMTGAKRLEAVELENVKTGEKWTMDVCAVFSMIGAKPCTNWLPPEIERDEKRFVKTGATVANAPLWQGMSRGPAALETSVPGVFAAGDVRSGSVKRCGAAVGEGGMAVEGIHQALGTYS